MNNPPPETLIKIYNRLYDSYGPQGWWPGRSRFEIMIGAILAQNTSWSNVEKAINNLRRESLFSSPFKLHSLDIKKLARLIRPAGCYNVKSKCLRNFTKFLIEKYEGNLSKLAKVNTGILRQELLAVSGIGPETCDSILLYGFGRPVFVIDAYTKRIFSRHGLFSEGHAYESAQKIFMDNLPSEEKLFNEYHALIVRLGKDYCRKSPDCAGCPLKGIKVVAKVMR